MSVFVCVLLLESMFGLPRKDARQKARETFVSEVNHDDLELEVGLLRNLSVSFSVPSFLLFYFFQ